MKATNFLFVFFIFFHQTALASGEITEPRAIAAAVERFLHEQGRQQLGQSENSRVKITLRTIDPRLRLPRCDKSLTLKRQSAQLQRNTSVKVSCEGSKPWSIYVSATLSLEKPVATLAKELPRHHVIGEDDIVMVPIDIYRLRSGYSLEAQPIIGQQLKRNLRTGDVIYSYHLQAPDIIKKGDRVSVMAKRGSLAVISPGIALNDASKGERIRVENERSSRVVHARVIGPGQVEVL